MPASSPVPPDKFEENYTSILRDTRDRLPHCQILLLEPFYISNEDRPGTVRHDVLRMLPAYIAVSHKMSRTYKTRLLRTHTMFQQIIRHQPADLFCPEPVHPNPVGHLAIAGALYDTLSCKGAKHDS
ncbi:MAG: hypothetical protein LC725_03605 [Lentisphaerae bacterium]|nr:hypothetical protein [Lentisphaerota bacterium]